MSPLFTRRVSYYIYHLQNMDGKFLTHLIDSVYQKRKVEEEEERGGGRGGGGGG